MMRVVLANDELLAGQELRQILKEIGDVELVGECASACETLQVVRLMNPDLLVLDLRLPNCDGFDLIDTLLAIPVAKRPQIVFVASNDQYAVRAFEVNAIDYVLKPCTGERLGIAIDRVREHQAVGANRIGGGKGVISNHTAGSNDQKTSERYPSQLVFKSRGRILFLTVNKILWIKAVGNYVQIWTASESHLIRATIRHLETRLDPRLFLRVHRSAIVNLQYLREVKNEPTGDVTAVLTTGERIGMSRSCKEQIQRLLRI